MKYLILILLAFANCTFASAQTVSGDKLLQKVLSLKMPLTAEDESPGRRGASVIWHPLQKKYYAAMAGNALYPLAIFNETGKRISADSLKCRQDTRGLWYNSSTKEIQGNCYSNYGWFKFTLNQTGMVTGSKIFLDGMNQPEEQSVGTFHSLSNEVLFLSQGKVFKYNSKDGKVNDSIPIHWGIKKDSLSTGIAGESLGTPESYNSTSVIYTGILNAELGFLNTVEDQIELYSYATGYLTKVLKLPEDIIPEAMFNFAFCNNTYWLFNMDERVWEGYK
jgi:hypothetical protein